eukprot:96236_1
MDYYREFVDGKWKWWCTKCKKHVSHKYLHQQIHDKVRFYCDKCSKSYSRKSTLKEHQQTVHEGLLLALLHKDKNFAIFSHCIIISCNCFCICISSVLIVTFLLYFLFL